ncbi:MAG: dNTP triphosphohydrolase [Oscillospiraceae bacterium]|nr:dNTP triphosphohydrolase [Oscillospiraceae bacterium]
MEWNKLLSNRRQCDKPAKPKQFARFAVDDFDDDFLSIISSQAFRRLQDKTQVFPLDKSDFVRTRLTHSMEVSTVARQLATMITQDNSEYLKEDFRNNPTLAHQIPTIVACAGLLHDTGNPPFGHYGEEVIRDWFRRKFRDPSFTFRGRPVSELLNEQMKADFENFEGNAQGLRIMAKSRLKNTSHDINLTYAVMNTLIKYPNPSTDFDHDDPDVKRHKLGYYYAEQDIMQELCEATGTLENGQYLRHPLVFIMEAADDIAYATADLEDSVKKECFTLDEFIAFYENQVKIKTDKQIADFRSTQNEAIQAKIDKYLHYRNKMQAEAKKSPDLKDTALIEQWSKERSALFETEEEKAVRDQLETLIEQLKLPLRQISTLKKTLYNSVRSPESDFVIFENWLEDVRMWLMYDAAYAFSYNYDSIMAGTYTEDLFTGTHAEDTLAILKATMAKYVYDCNDVVALELSARRIVESLLEDFITAVMYYEEPDAKGNLGTIDSRFICMIPDNFKEDYLGAKANLTAAGKAEEGELLYLRFLMVTDFISGMTDSFAKNLYQISNGLD